MKSTVSNIAQKLRSHVESVSPGHAFRLTEAHDVGDGVWQGDLGIEIAAGVPSGYVVIESPADEDRQLVPLGGGPGSHHRLESLDGVTLYRPSRWGEDETDLRGPCIVFAQPNAIVHNPGTAHPHGTVHIDRPMTVLCRYQRNLAADEREAKRAAD